VEEVKQNLGIDPVTGRRRRIGEVLVAQGLLTEEQLQRLLDSQKDIEAGAPRKRLGQLVIDAAIATEKQVAEALATALGLDLVDLGRLVISPEHARLLPRAVAERSGVLVVDKADGRVTVATSDPTNVVALDDVKLYTRAQELIVVVATDSQVRDHLGRSWSLSEDSAGMDTLFEQMSEDTQDEQVATDAVDNAPIVRLVDVVLADAVRARASDIHIEPQAGELRIRYRVDGLLRDVMTVPRSAASAAVSRIKIVSGLDIAERRRPQDGRAKLTVDGMTVEARISTLPTLHGEKVVIRLLPRAENVPLLSKTGLQGSQMELLEAALSQSQGLILITGPTGSGKTNTLYSALQSVSTPERNIVTLEDPVEVQVKGITQVQINERQGMTFARGIRSVLRQDPDIVLVGEARDLETASLALEASLTGHLVLTTLHTNDAVSAITRLVEMGCESFLVASSLTLAIAQRLVRTPCPACTADYVVPPKTLALLGLTEHDLADATPKRGKGCADCGGTGYKGRMGVFECLPITASMRRVLLTTPTEAAIGAAARENGMQTLRASALAAAHRGETTYEEVLRVTQVDTSEGHICPTCARAMADDMLICPWDGTVVARGACESCGKHLDAEWAHCPYCRTAVAGFVPQPVDHQRRASDQEPVRRLPRVLVVDHDPHTCAAVTAALAGQAEVVSALDAESGLAALGGSDFDGVLLDTQLPDLPGVEFVRLIRADPATVSLPIMVFTPDLGFETESLAVGANAFLAQPADPETVRDAVLSLLARRHRAQLTAV
jgi:type IV pilus assembly protein PilB